MTMVAKKAASAKMTASASVSHKATIVLACSTRTDSQTMQHTTSQQEGCKATDVGAAAAPHLFVTVEAQFSAPYVAGPTEVPTQQDSLGRLLVPKAIVHSFKGGRWAGCYM